MLLEPSCEGFLSCEIMSDTSYLYTRTTEHPFSCLAKVDKFAEGLLLDGVGTIDEDSFATLFCEHIERCFQRSIIFIRHSVHTLLTT